MLVQLASLGSGVAQNPGGAVVAGVPGTIVLHGTNSPATIYADEAGDSPNAAGTFTTDSFGRIPGWIDGSQPIDILISPAPLTTVVFNVGDVDGGTAGGSSVDTIDGGSAASN